MRIDNPQPATAWTSKQAYILAIVCLLLGTAIGYLARGSSASRVMEGNAASTAAAASESSGMSGSAEPTPEQLREMAAKQVAPVLEQLKSRPDDPSLMTTIANFYYDARQYDDAIFYYQKVLQAHPDDADVRSDMATCYWYKNDPDTAIQEFEKTLTFAPGHANSLFNLGIVKWQGKGDPKGAIDAWETLLKLNPGYDNKDRVLNLIARARQHIATTGKPKS
jgi:tetratricopeptide (TPR) repeat protein